jgi:hypothetical protein
MIHISVDLSNPWRTKTVWDILWNKSGSITRHKAWEFNGYRTDNIISVDLDLRFKGDHPGARIMLCLLGFAAELHFYDIRHAHIWTIHD